MVENRNVYRRSIIGRHVNMIMVIITVKSQRDSDKKKVIESNWLFFKVNRKENRRENSDVAFA
ncbi:hypothetical protein DMB41_14015 [Pectobacterium carotovorum subsp. carotovorum]|nr:hypothetical protein DMB41_14015 [Pectobacterium carotovorum subsp. carotovorum]